MKSLINTGLPDSPNGLSDKEFGLVAPLYRAIQALELSVAQLTGAVQYSQSELQGLSPVAGALSGRSDFIIAEASELLTYGNAVNLHASGGELKARKADAESLTLMALGFVADPGTYAVGTKLKIQLSGYTAGVTGATLNRVYYLSNLTPGTIQDSPPVGSGAIIQPVGYGLGSLGFLVNISSYYSVN